MAAVVLMTGLWIVLNERFDVTTVAVGIVVVVVSLVATNRIVLKGRYRAIYRLRPLRALLYFLRLLYEIYAAGFQAVHRMLTGRTHVGVVDIKTNLTDEFAVCLLANSITLTPGTVTLARSGQDLKVIWLNAETRDPEAAGEAIKGQFERRLSKVVR